MRKYAFLFFLLFLSITLVGCSGSQGEEPDRDVSAETEDTATEEEQVDEEVQTEEVDNSADQSKSFIEDELDPLVNSVSSNIDTNWQFYFEEPVQRLSDDGDLEAFKTDLGLLVDLFKGIVADIEALEVPDYLSEEDAEDVNQIKEGLKGAVNKRIEAAETLIAMTDVQEVLDTDVVGLIEESNEELNTAVEAYESLINTN